MWPWTEQSLLREQLAKAEARAEQAEVALVTERDARMRDVRHVLSAWLRHEKAFPLPAEEKSQAKSEEAQKLPVLSDVQTAMRDANRKEATALGYTEAEADELFMRHLDSLTME